MTGATPLEAAHEIFNRLAVVEPDGSTEAAQFVIQLARLNRQNPGDVTTRTAYAQALLLTGNRDAALAQIDAAYGLRNGANYAVSDRLAVLHMCIAARQNAKGLALRTYFAAKEGAAPDAMHNAALVALWLGDMVLLKRTAAAEAGRGEPSIATDFVNILSSSFMAETLEGHQRIVIDCLGQTQAWVEFATDHDATPLIMITHYLATDAEGLRSTERQIYDRLGEYYVGLDMNPGAYLPHLYNALCLIERTPILSVG